MQIITSSEAKKMAKLAGTLLEKEFPVTNFLAKSVAGSALKCFGDTGKPSSKVLENANKIKTAGTKVYKASEVKLANAIVDYKRIRREN